MNNNELLKAIKENDYSVFSEYLNEGGDCDLMIRGKSVLTHAVNHNAIDLIYLLLLYGADLRDLKHTPNWLNKLDGLDPQFPQMVKELEEARLGFDHSLNAQFILNEACQMILGNYPISFRNVMHHTVRNHGYATKLWVGIHLFEYRNWEYLSVVLRKIFQCEDTLAPEFTTKSSCKYAMILRATVLTEYDEEIPGLSHRIKGFLEFLEVPVSQLEYQLECLEKDEALVLGVHFSDEPSLVVQEDRVDVDSKFFDSMKEVICSTLKPRFESSRFTFDGVRGWDDQLNQWVQAFKNRFGVYPNILQASSATYARIDLVANSRRRDHLQGPGQESAPEGEFVSMGGFVGQGYALDFCILESMAVDSVELIYDSNPDGGMPIPKRVAA